jgi:hypothetical protein
MVFRKDNPLSILEIFPPAHVVPYHYAILANRYGYDYTAISGEDIHPVKGCFTVDTAKLEEEIIEMLRH